MAMTLPTLFSFSALIQCSLSLLKRHIGITAVAFNEDLDLVQKLFMDKITEYRMKLWVSGGHADSGPETQQDLERELLKLKQMYGQADINMSHTLHVKILNLQ
ncbi:ATP synthase-coupling factor 6, mitochondrial-like [Mustela erminea]|uniref:ATP synthase-coupling factor 6, mitochondrial-like n=1 Tax=Mustela erminea TaxID=36723 RepID=UPI0013867C34|nr:ATP synthase-coupling factor 6, mitochondrial-like [Mustela erminea]